MRIHYFITLLSFIFLTGCQSTFGPSAINNTHIPYNQAIVDTLNQQMLLNIVRLKYHDEPYYLKVGSVTASLKFTGSAGINTNIDLGPGRNAISPNLGFGYTDSPTISYQPLTGEDLFKSVLTNVPLGKLFVLSSTGWSINQIFSLCVENINGVGNAIRASGLTPKLAPKYQQYERVLSLLKALQDEGSLKVGPSSKEKGGRLMKFIETSQNRAIIEELVTLLNLERSSRLVAINNIDFLDVERTAYNDSLTIYTRSISSMLFYLSHNIQVPQEHIDAGLVTVTQTNEGQLFDWNQTPVGKIFKIKSSSSYPDNAFLAVSYHDYWYYIANNDLQSKSTFMLLMQLFDHQSGRSKSTNPVLTIPVR
jgi:hypothetical protein